MEHDRLALLVRLARVLGEAKRLTESLIEEEARQSPEILILDPVEASIPSPAVRVAEAVSFHEITLEEIVSEEFEKKIETIREENFRKCLVKECFAKANRHSPFCWFHDQQIEQSVQVEIYEEEGPLSRSDSFLENLFVKRAKK